MIIIIIIIARIKKQQKLIKKNNYSNAFYIEKRLHSSRTFIIIKFKVKKERYIFFSLLEI